MKQVLIPLLLLLLTAIPAAAQSSTTSSVLTLSIPAYVQLDDSSLPASISTLGSGLDPANNVITSTVQSHTVEVLTNSASGADLTLAVNGSGGGSASPWEDVTIAVTEGAGSTSGLTAAAGSSPGTFNTRNCTANCSAFLVSDMKGGNYTYEVQFQVTLANRFALAGNRTFNAVYTVTL